jgi:predicted metal-dependent hydrolase
VSVSTSQLALFKGEDAVVIRRSPRARRLTLRVFPHGVVELVAPMRASRGSIENFLQSNAGWIAQARGKFRTLQPDAGFAPPGEIRLAALAERWCVDHHDGRKGLDVHPLANGGRLVLTGPDEPQWRRQRLRAWLMARARATLPPWLAGLSRQTGLEYTGVTVRRQRSRWGSCSAHRRISLNCALLFLEPALVTHLLVHELAHTKHLNHSRAYWRLVETLDSEFKLLDRRLRDAWSEVPAWVNYDAPVT